MTHGFEPVYLRFRGHTRRLPLLSIATVLPHRDLEGAARALEILIHGPPELRATAAPDPPAVSAKPRGEGVGGGVQEQTQPNLSCEQKQEHGDGGAGGRGRDALLDELVAGLGSDANRIALARLVAAHPDGLLRDALRRTLAIPPERIRTSRSAIFTGIVRKLAGPTP